MKVEFYFDPISPYAWLAFYKLSDLLKKRPLIELETIPVLFPTLITAHGSKGPAEIPAKRDYVWLDVMRLCKKMNLQFKSPPEHPFNPLKALRVCEAIKNQKERFDLSFKIADAAWGRGLDICNDNVLAELLVECGQD